MKILINCPFFFNLNYNNNNRLGGIESLNLSLAKEISKKKIHHVTIATHCTNITFKENIKNIPIDYLKLNHKKYQFDVVVSSNDASIFDFFKRSKNFLWLHNPLQIEKSIRKNQLFPILRNRPSCIFVSSYLQSITSKLFFFIKRIVIPNFLLPNFTKKIIKFKRKNIFVWSVQREKGLNDIIKIWIKTITPLNSKAELHIFGINKLPYGYKIKYLQSKLIFFKGRVGKSILKNTYQKSLAMICLGYDETFCLNALEANSCGLPVLTLGKTALKDYVKNNYNGFVAKNYNELSLILIKMININKVEHKNLIKNSILWSKKYHLRQLINNWFKIF